MRFLGNIVPSPVHFLLKEDNTIYIKREDLIPFSFGGNKARKAIYFFKEIDKLGNDCVVTYGSSSSNHCRVVSNMAAMRNLPCIIIGPEESSKPTFNSMMMKMFGAEVITVPVEQVHDTIESTLSDLKDKGMNPYFIEGGGHGHWGTQAFVDCYEEISEFERQEEIHFDYIFFASGTGTTQAGLVCGQLMHKDNRRIIGISIARKNPRGRQVVLNSIKSYFHETGVEISDSAISNATIFLDNYTGEGYGRDLDSENAVIHEMLKRHGIPLDSTYTAKAYIGMRSYLEEKKIIGKTVLFIHTGGTPLFFDSIK